MLEKELEKIVEELEKKTENQEDYKVEKII